MVKAEECPQYSALANHYLCSDPRVGCGTSRTVADTEVRIQEQPSRVTYGVRSIDKADVCLLTHGHRRFFFVGYIFFHLPCFRDCYGLFLILLAVLRCLAILDLYSSNEPN